MPIFEDYRLDDFYDELFSAPGVPRRGASALIARLGELPQAELNRRQKAAEVSMMQAGVTFTVYGNNQGTDRIIPFDLIPRIIESHDWEKLEAGLKQRVIALNLFLIDIYGDQKIVKDGIIPAHVIHSGKSFRPQCVGLRPPKDVWCHINGIDLVRDSDGTFYVLEDNMRCPSGVSYVLENRQLLKRTFPLAFTASRVKPVDDYPNRLLEMLQYVAPKTSHMPVCCLLTPGVFNSAYFEHAFLARQMGVELVEGRDLVVADGFVHMRTTGGFEKVDVIYRRIDDDFIDPQAFNADSMLGVPGIMEVYRAGRVALANAPGTGIADDKVVYAYVPAIIKYYLKQDPILPNVPTYVCWDDKQREHVLANLDKFVVKAANEAGGYGMLVGMHASKEERAEFARRIQANPRNYIGQPTVSLSRCPVIVDDNFEGRHVDLRPYVLYGQDVYVLPGGLTRVALKKGSLVVNSSQGGGSKDTWVLEDGDPKARLNQLQAQMGRTAEGTRI